MMVGIAPCAIFMLIENTSGNVFEFIDREIFSPLIAIFAHSPNTSSYIICEMFWLFFANRQSCMKSVRYGVGLDDMCDIRNNRKASHWQRDD